MGMILRLILGKGEAVTKQIGRKYGNFDFEVSLDIFLRKVFRRSSPTRPTKFQDSKGQSPENREEILPPLLP